MTSASEIIIDVRERDEYVAEHIQDAIHIPLSSFDTAAPGVLPYLKDKKLVFMCTGGPRAELAVAHLHKIGFNGNSQCSVYPGGLIAWKKQGKPTIKSGKKPLPILRQVQLIAGSIIVLTVALGYWVAPGFLAIAAFFGLGLTVAGLTGFCGMAKLLALMPWNKG